MAEWETLTDSESLLEWERAHVFHQESSEHGSIDASPLRHATAKSYPSNPRAPYFSTPGSEMHFSLKNLNPGLPPPSFDNRVNPSSLDRLPTGTPLPIPSLAETIPKSLRLEKPSQRSIRNVGNPQILQSHHLLQSVSKPIRVSLLNFRC